MGPSWWLMGKLLMGAYFWDLWEPTAEVWEIMTGLMESYWWTHENLLEITGLYWLEPCTIKPWDCWGLIRYSWWDFSVFRNNMDLGEITDKDAVIESDPICFCVTPTKRHSDPRRFSSPNQLDPSSALNPPDSSRQRNKLPEIQNNTYRGA